jgi:hypothetical protein
VDFPRKKKKKRSNWIFESNQVLVDLPEQEEAAATTAMKKGNKAYYLQPEDTETKETLKKAKIRAAELLRKDTLARHSHRLRSINNRIQQHQRQ